ncbi:MAG TPA: hypothetical protein VGD60_00750 [Candidatus Acidoferrales bacterium]
MLPDKKTAALRRRIAPSTPLTLELEQEYGPIIKVELKLAFDMTAAAALQEKTQLLLTDYSIWKHIGEPKLLATMLWAACLSHHPELDVDEGPGVIGSYIQENNADQVTEALWQAYLAYLPKAKREKFAQLKAEAEEKAKRGDETESPLDETKTPASGTIPSAGSISGPLPDTTSASVSASSAS